MRWAEPRLPSTTLVRALGGPLRAAEILGDALDVDSGRGVHMANGDLSPEAVAKRRIQRLQRWGVRNTMIEVDLADRLAVKAGLHPAQVWPEWCSLPTKELRHR